ncbi:MAG: hypothetical protein IJK05_09850 [Bacteroidales bacterium]|nr:hypothetical protein [Bacteroidales bacterium]
MNLILNHFQGFHPESLSRERFWNLLNDRLDGRLFPTTRNERPESQGA